MDVYVPRDLHKVIFSPPLKQLLLYYDLDCLLLGLCFYTVTLDGDVAVQRTHVMQSASFLRYFFSPLIYSEIYWVRLHLGVYCVTPTLYSRSELDLAERFFSLQHRRTNSVPG